MNPIPGHKEKILKDGFAIINDVFQTTEMDSLSRLIAEAVTNNPAFRKTNNLFAIRRFFKEVPGAYDLVFSGLFKSTLAGLFGDDYFVVKSLYFDKPEQSNWFVAYHQDLTISVAQKADVTGFRFWTVRQDQVSVQPPAGILENNFTVRLHLDDTDEKNGALKVIPGSHSKGICRVEKLDRTTEKEVICKVRKGGIMIMRPLLFHASERTTDNRRRRVIHIEFTNCSLPNPLQWSERTG